jgi:hypothetical protein
MQDRFPVLPEEPTYEDVLQAVRDSVAGYELPALGEVLTGILERKAKAEELMAGIEAEEKGIQSVIIRMLEDRGLTSLTTKNGMKFALDPQVDAKVPQDQREALVKWIEANSMKSLLSVHGQTLSAMCRRRLEAGEELPDGVEMVPRNQLKVSGRARK